MVSLTIRQALQQRRLLEQSRRLLREYQKQLNLLDEIERMHPGITQLETDEDGATLIDDSDDADVETPVREIQAAMRI